MDLTEHSEYGVNLHNMLEFNYDQKIIKIRAILNVGNLLLKFTRLQFESKKVTLAERFIYYIYPCINDQIVMTGLKLYIF